MRICHTLLSLVLIMALSGTAWGEDVAVSGATEDCLACHVDVTPGIVADWKNSLHYRTTPADALQKPDSARRVSAKTIPQELADVTVGCAECHQLNAAEHADTFDHEGADVHVVVTPRDCATCHPIETEQYDRNKMAWAHTNLNGNPLYRQLIGVVNGPYTFSDGRLTVSTPDDRTNAESCNHCHGTAVQIAGTVTRDTSQGTMEFPVLVGWPNQGVGRINPDHSRGSCTACHTRHMFAVSTARQPYTCAQCHKGPDVPAYKVYEVSKHGNIFSTHKQDWDFKAVPWTAGQDFAAPTCAVCHISQVVDAGGNVTAQRTHAMNDRLPWRLFGLIYAHPQPKSPDTTVITNQAGLPLPTELTGQPVKAFLIDQAGQSDRTQTMQGVCRSCHASGWVEGHWANLENTIHQTNAQTLAATRIILQAWDSGVVKGPGAQDSPFNEALERLWVEQWLFYANSTRLASAMGGADYGVFADGRWFLTKNLLDMAEWLEHRRPAAK